MHVYCTNHWNIWHIQIWTDCADYIIAGGRDRHIGTLCHITLIQYSSSYKCCCPLQENVQEPGVLNITHSSKGVDLYPWLGGMIGAKIFSAMDQSNQEVDTCGRLHPLPKRVASRLLKKEDDSMYHSRLLNKSLYEFIYLFIYLFLIFWQGSPFTSK